MSSFRFLLKQNLAELLKSLDELKKLTAELFPNFTIYKNLQLNLFLKPEISSQEVSLDFPIKNKLVELL